MLQAVGVAAGAAPVARGQNDGSAVATRRPPAHRSVSLRHHAGSSLSRQQNDPSQPGSTASSLEANHNSSGETSNADHWFENSNQKAMKDRVLNQDNEPPFFLKNHSSEESALDRSPQDPNNTQTTAALRPRYERYVSMGSSSEDYRSVIDDLTVQNKNLRKKLKKYEKYHDPQLKSDKLFEVKVHGLPVEKKRELEETLKQFALSMESPNDAVAAARLGHKKQTVAKPSSSSTRVADSGYGSMSASGQASMAQSQAQSSRENKLSDNPAETSAARNQNIQSFLHDIPEGLMPRHSTAMTERARKKMVVLRLEEIFGGRGAEPGGHQHPIQQQEVSQSAAKADRSDAEARGQKTVTEGIREAHIMSGTTEDPMDFQRADIKSSEDRIDRGSQSPKDKDAVSERDFASAASPLIEQRPTRPLDLDPQRAQVPEENIDYIRHLGFPLNGQDSPMDGEGWIYLNLLINMAQLHTINVTPAFVKTAIMEHSRKFELSADGRKIRWRGGRDVTSTSSPSSGEEPAPSRALDLGYRNTERKRTRSDNLDSLSGSVEGQPTKKAHLPSVSDKLAYQPLFLTNPDRGDDDDEDDSVTNTESPNSSSDAGNLTGDSSGLAAFGKAKVGSTKPREDGPIIFYNNAKFCTDLSGDKSKSFERRVPDYRSITSHPLGLSAPSTTSLPSSSTSDSPLTGTTQAQPMDIDQQWSPNQFSFPVNTSSPKRVSFAEAERPVEFEASGLGGVRPEDNVTITVTRQHNADSSMPAPRPIKSSKVVKLGTEVREHTPVPDTILSVRRKELAPSALPPASYAYYSDDESDFDDDDSSDNDEEGMIMSHNDDFPGLATPAHTIPSMLTEQQSTDASSDKADASSGEDEEADDQSLDFLATARAADPAAVRAKEREYDAEMAERLAEDIPAGSSAATAGGGSGFNSPVVDGEGEEGDPKGSVSS